MGPDDVRGAYILYIGAGAVAAGGIISLGRSLPLIWQGIRAGLSDFGAAAQAARADASRTERDFPMKFVGLGCLALVAAILAAPSLHMNLAGGGSDRGVRLSFRDGFVAAHRGDRVVVQSRSRG